jgi:oxaloacetate decarboxylase gamma subunit
MTIFDMLEQSGVLTLLGMGVVFGFLIILIFAISATGKIINRSVNEREVQPAVSSVQKTGTDQGVTAAISAAVNEYRKNNK